MTDIFNPLKVFSDIATARRWRFIYGSRAYANWEIESQTLTNAEVFMYLLPIVEKGNGVNGLPDVSLYTTSVCLGRKFDPAPVTVPATPITVASTLDETEKQKYDRRLKELTYYLKHYVLSNLFCSNSNVEVVSWTIIHMLNEFDVNVDMVQLNLDFNIDWNYTNDEL
jgi:hypothetical protein